MKAIVLCYLAVIFAVQSGWNSNEACPFTNENDQELWLSSSDFFFNILRNEIKEYSPNSSKLGFNFETDRER